MTAAAGLLTRLVMLGVSVSAEGGALRLRPASAIPADLLADLRTHKDDILAHLTTLTDEPAPVLMPYLAPAEPDEERVILEANARVALAHTTARQDAEGIALVLAWFQRFNETA